MDMRAKTCCFTRHRSMSGAEKLRQYRTEKGAKYRRV